MNKKLISFTLGAMVFAVCSSTNAQHPGKIHRIGYISGTGSLSDPGPYVEALRQGLRDLGWIDGKNFTIEYRGAEGKPERTPGLVSELVQSKVDLMVLVTESSIRAAKQLTNTIPIVVVTGVDPVATGLVSSLARPGGNITGLTTLSRELNGKRLELVTEAVPKTARVAVLRDPRNQTAAIVFNEYEATARTLKIQLQSLDVRDPEVDLERAFQTALKGRTNALITVTSVQLFLRRKQIAELAIKNRLPSMYQGSAWVEDGGLMSYSINDLDAFRRAATYVDKILKGAKPADLPVEQPTKFELVINLKTAKQIGLAIPPNVLARADRVIK
jgi:putative ABC transport system substrate-binding protein